MCKECVKEVFKDRERTCLETGTWWMNYKGCKECHSMSDLIVTEYKKEEDDTSEEITYKHVCKKCGHEVAEHSYSFAIEDDEQEYIMSCLLCGNGGDSVSISPDDPRRARGVF